MIKTETVVGVFDTDIGLTSVATPGGIGQTSVVTFDPNTNTIKNGAAAVSAGGGSSVTVVNDLTTGGSAAALSAEQGKSLKGQVDAAASGLGPVADLATLNSTYPAATNKGKQALVGSAAPYARYQSDGSTWQRANTTMVSTHDQVYKAKLAMGKYLQGGRTILAAFGDSTSVDINVTPNTLVSKTVAGFIASLLQGRGFANAYVPAVGVHNLSITAGGVYSFDSRVTIGTGVTNANQSTMGEFVVATGQTLTFTFTSQTTDTLDIYYLKNSGLGTFSYAVNGGGATNINTSGTAGFGKTTVNVTAGANTIVLTGVSGSSYILGVDAYLSTAASMPVFLCARSGHTILGESANFAATKLAALINPDVVWVNYAANEWGSVAGATYTAAQYASACLAVGSAATNASTIVLTGYPGNNANYTSVGASCNLALRSAAAAAGVPFIDSQRIFGGDSASWSVANARGFMGGDTLHPTPAATAMIALEYVAPLFEAH